MDDYLPLKRKYRRRLLNHSRSSGQTEFQNSVEPFKVHEFPLDEIEEPRRKLRGTFQI